VILLDEQNSSKIKEETTEVELTSIRRLSYLLLGGNLFCYIVLFGPDTTFIPADAVLRVPMFGTDISAKVFLIFFPICLVCLNLYGQILINSILVKGPKTTQNDTFPGDPNKQEPEKEIYKPSLVNFFIFYLLTPVTLLISSWRALPRPEVIYLIPSTILFTIGIVFLRKWQMQKKGCKPITIWAQWLRASSIILLCFFLLHFLFPQALHSLRPIDLVMAKLSEKDLRGVNLTHANLDYIILNSSNLTGANLESARLEKAQLENTILRGARLDYALLKHANLKNADLRKASLKHVNFMYAILNNANLSHTNMFYADFKNTDLRDANLNKANIQKGSLVQVKLNNAEMRGANLASAYLIEANMSNVKASSANFNLAIFKKVILKDSKLDFASLIGADFDEAKLDNVSIVDADLTCATLKNSKFINVDLSGAFIVNVDFSGTELSGTILQGADLRGAVNLTCDQLWRTTGWERSKREKSLKCGGNSSEKLFEPLEETTDCELIKTSLKNDIDILN
jgi:uncharacterized protein YjbI with pentapeptide repeats